MCDSHIKSCKKTPPQLRHEKPKKSSENHQKEKTGETTKALRNHAESSIHTMKVHTRSILPPNHPTLSQDITMKLSS
jgi:hypothetical protein